jgi:hypothetical protein
MAESTNKLVYQGEKVRPVVSRTAWRLEETTPLVD